MFFLFFFPYAFFEGNFVPVHRAPCDWACFGKGNFRRLCKEAKNCLRHCSSQLVAYASTEERKRFSQTNSFEKISQYLNVTKNQNQNEQSNLKRLLVGFIIVRNSRGALSLDEQPFDGLRFSHLRSRNKRQAFRNIFGRKRGGLVATVRHPQWPLARVLTQCYLDLFYVFQFDSFLWDQWIVFVARSWGRPFAWRSSCRSASALYQPVSLQVREHWRVKATRTCE